MSCNVGDFSYNEGDFSYNEGDFSCDEIFPSGNGSDVCYGYDHGKPHTAEALGVAILSSSLKRCRCYPSVFQTS
jgi:hypothetical protein